ncbi:TonB-dependent receptor [Flavobacteriaceae bacterium 3-367]|uniref:TonB-dependent receptor n=1 Tax=Eudoraea algarum TaxID=3417568 RepID=UPI003275D042
MKKIAFSLLLAMSLTYNYAQNTLNGTITDSESALPLEQVTIYFPQLEKGAISDAEGNYRINNLPLGTYKLVVSYIGYQTYSRSITILSGANSLRIDLSPSAIEMEEVIVSTPFHKLQRENVVKVAHETVANLKARGAVTLAQGITNIPGVETVSTGLGIGKPVIRGLSFNRVLVYTQGIRLENQQFGDEHGLGISDAGIESVEVIKGPASLLYGSDALGGVLYLNPEKFAIPKTNSGDINLNYFSNTEGLNANAGFKASSERFKFLLRGSVASHVDYNTGEDVRVTNSRFREYDIKAGVGYQAATFKTELRYNYNRSDLGIPEELGEQTKSRSPGLPNQEIDNHILSSKTSIFFERSSLDATLGYTFNDRREFEEEEGTEEAALDMDLKTFSYNVQYRLPEWRNLETIFGVQGMHQRNENFGEEILIPDAITNDIGFLGTSHLHFKNNSDLQLGIRYDHRAINGEASGLPSEEDFIPELDRNFNSFNAAIGYKMGLSKNLVGRLNLATGFRAPNLAELTSNGVHEGTNRFEIGDPDLGNEQNVQVDLALEYSSEHLELSVNGFHNTVSDFIFIEPNGEFVGEDAVFLYRQQDARLYGGEVGLHLHPHPLDWLHVESSFAMVIGELDDDSSLPLIPANSITNTVRVEFNKTNTWLLNSYAFVSLQSVFDQERVSSFETFTDGYNLLDVGLGGNLLLFDQEVSLRLTANNLLDKTYIAHLSRLKTDGIPNIGRNISLGLSILL